MTTAAKVATRHSQLSTPFALLLAVLAVVLLWRIIPWGPTVLVLAVVGLMLLLGLNRPVWLIAAIVISQLTITTYYVNTPFGINISLRLVLLIIIGLILIRSYRQGQFNAGPQARSLLLPTLILIVISLISDIANTSAAVAFKDFRDLIAGLMILGFIPVAVRSVYDLKILGAVAFVGIASSALIGIMQNYNILGMQSVMLIPQIIDADFRIPGMAESSLELSYVISSVFLVLFCLLFVKTLAPGLKLVMFSAMLVLAGAIYLTYSRSALIAIMFGIFSIFFFLKTRIRSEIVLVGFLLMSGILMITPLGNESIVGRAESSQENSSVARLILWQAGINIALDHPLLGIGTDKFYEVSAQYQSSVDTSLIAYEKQEYWGYRTLGNQPIHNDYLNFWVSNGTLALLAFIWIFIAIMHNLAIAFQYASNNFLKLLSAGLAASLVAYGVNTFYHNVLGTISLFWILGGLALAVAKLSISGESSP